VRYRYYDPIKNWHRIRPHLAEVEHVLVRDFNKFTWGRSRKKFQAGQLPHEFESCGWYLDHRGPKPAYWWYVKHAACHWLVNHNLELARRVRPKDQWRILSSSQHSTVYNGHGLLFDLTFHALGISAQKAYEMARKPDGKILPPGKHLPVSLAEHSRAPKVPAVLLRGDRLRTRQQTVHTARALGPVPAEASAPGSFDACKFPPPHAPVGCPQDFPFSPRHRAQSLPRGGLNSPCGFLATRHAKGLRRLVPIEQRPCGEGGQHYRLWTAGAKLLL